MLRLLNADSKTVELNPRVLGRQLEFPGIGSDRGRGVKGEALDPQRPQSLQAQILLAPSQRAKLHVRVDAGTGAQGNISPVNVEEFNGVRSLSLSRFNLR